RLGARLAGNRGADLRRAAAGVVAEAVRVDPAPVRRGHQQVPVAGLEAQRADRRGGQAVAEHRVVAAGVVAALVDAGIGADDDVAVVQDAPGRRGVGQVAGDVGERLAGVGRLEDV